LATLHKTKSSNRRGIVLKCRWFGQWFERAVI
jgi:hypothetical protein